MVETIPIRNARLEDILSKCVSTVLEFVDKKQDVLNLGRHEKIGKGKEEFADLDPCGEEYLRLAFDMCVAGNGEYGYPMNSRLVEMETHSTDNKHVLRDDIEPVRKQRRRLHTFVGAQVSALMCYYPPGGYIGWHHNGNAYGLNSIFTWSENGDGCFKYRDAETGEIVIVPDQPGWQCKMGEFPSELDNPPDKLFWHSAQTNCPRITIGFILTEPSVSERLRLLIQNDAKH